MYSEFVPQNYLGKLLNTTWLFVEAYNSFCNALSNITSWFLLQSFVSNTDVLVQRIYERKKKINTQNQLSIQHVLCSFVKCPSHISVWALRMTTFCHSLSYADARREVVERTFRARHTHSYVGTRCVRREILCMHKNSLRMPTYGPYAASTLCTRYANVPRVRSAVGVRWRYVHSTLTLLDTKCVNFTTSPLRVGSEFWTFCQRTVCVFSAYAYRIKIDSEPVAIYQRFVSVSTASCHRMSNVCLTFAYRVINEQIV